VAALARACSRLNELDESSRAEALDLIQRHAEHLNAILDDVREVADSLNHTSTDSTCSLVEVVRTSAACAGLPTNRLRMELGSESVFVSTSASALGRILTNLLQNAVRYGPPEGSVRVVTRRCSQADETEVAVQDRGHGPGGSGDRQVVGAMGLGSRVVDELTASLGGSVVRRAIQDGYEVAVRLPDHRAAPSPRRASGSWSALAVGPGRPLAGP
jgi:signal transduction histidine kinase